jgi:hypothetical protein
MLVRARQYQDVVKMSLAVLDGPGAARNSVCQSLAALGLRSGGPSAGIDCSGARDVVVRVTRQSFENPHDPGLRFVDTTLPAAWLHASHRPRQDHVVGGHQRQMINSFDRPAEPRVTGAVVYGPLKLPAERFGILLGGRRGQSKMYVTIDRWTGQRWSEVARLTRQQEGDTLLPHLARLSTTPGQQVRVRIVDDGIDGYLLADAITFIDIAAP